MSSETNADVHPTPHTSPTEVTPDAVKSDSIRKVAIVGEIPFAGIEVVKAVLGAGLVARVLCPNSAVEAKLRDLPHQDRLELVDGDLGNATAVSSALADVYGVCFVSPIGLAGRLYRSTEHLDDVRNVIQASEAHALRRVVYHSAVGASKDSVARAIQDAAAAEELLTHSRCEHFLMRTGPLVGRGDGFMSEIVGSARKPGLFMVVQGYGGTLVQPLAVADFAHCMARVFTPQGSSLSNGTFALVGPEVVSLLELTDSALQELKRGKLKFHAPLFVLKIAASMSSDSKFKERVAMLFHDVLEEHNDALTLIGSDAKLTTPVEAQRALLAS